MNPGAGPTCGGDAVPGVNLFVQIGDDGLASRFSASIDTSSAGVHRVIQLNPGASNQGLGYEYTAETGITLKIIGAGSDDSADRYFQIMVKYATP